MFDGHTLVFVEVRLRSNGRFSSSAGSVNGKKQTRLLATASWFLQREPALDRHPIRFDVVAYDRATPDAAPRWIRQAFDASH